MASGKGEKNKTPGCGAMPTQKGGQGGGEPKKKKLFHRLVNPARRGMWGPSNTNHNVPSHLGKKPLGKRSQPSVA